MIHDNVAQEMIDAGVAKFLEEPVQKDRFDRTRETKKSFGCKASIDIDDPNYFLAADKVGDNISKKEDGH